MTRKYIGIGLNVIAVLAFGSLAFEVEGAARWMTLVAALAFLVLAISQVFTRPPPPCKRRE